MSKRDDIRNNIVTTIDAVGSVGSVIANRTDPISEDDASITFPVVLVFLGQGVNMPDKASLGYDMWNLPVAVHVITLNNDLEALHDAIYTAIHADSERGGNAILTQSTDGIELELDFDIPAEAQASTAGYEVFYEVPHGTL